MNAGWLGERVAEFRALRQLRTFPRREELALVVDGRRGARGRSCPGEIPGNCTLSSLSHAASTPPCAQHANKMSSVMDDMEARTVVPD